jgi:hypothetical protein
MGASVSLLVEGDTAEELVAYSRELCRLQESEVRLGENGVPHLTVLKSTVRCNVSPNEARAKVEDLIGLSFHLTFAGLNLMPSRSNPGLWIEVQVLRSTELMALHQRILSRYLFPRHEIESDSGDSWRTHITVARYPGPVLRPLPTPRSILRRKGVPSRLVVGSAGNTFNPIF